MNFKKTPTRGIACLLVLLLVLSCFPVFAAPNEDLEDGLPTDETPLPEPEKENPQEEEPEETPVVSDSFQIERSSFSLAPADAPVATYEFTIRTQDGEGQPIDEFDYVPYFVGEDNQYRMIEAPEETAQVSYEEDCLKITFQFYAEDFQDGFLFFGIRQKAPDSPQWLPVKGDASYIFGARVKYNQKGVWLQPNQFRNATIAAYTGRNQDVADGTEYDFGASYLNQSLWNIRFTADPGDFQGQSNCSPSISFDLTVTHLRSTDGLITTGGSLSQGVTVDGTSLYGFCYNHDHVGPNGHGYTTYYQETQLEDISDELRSQLRKALFAGFNVNGMGFFQIDEAAMDKVEFSEEEFLKLLAVPQEAADVLEGFEAGQALYPGELYRDFATAVWNYVKANPSSSLLETAAYRASFLMQMGEGDVARCTEQYRQVYLRGLGGLYTSAQAFSSTQNAIWQLLHEAGVPGNTKAGNLDALGQKIYDYAKSEEALPSDESASDFQVNDTVFRPSGEGGYLSDPVTIQGEGTFTLVNLPEQITIQGNQPGDNTVQGGQSFRLVTSECPTVFLNNTLTVHAQTIYVPEAVRFFQRVDSMETVQDLLASLKLEEVIGVQSFPFTYDEEKKEEQGGGKDDEEESKPTPTPTPDKPEPPAVEIPDEEVPQNELPPQETVTPEPEEPVEETTEIPDEEVPQGELPVPLTGSNELSILLVLLTLSGAALGVLLRRKHAQVR